MAEEKPKSEARVKAVAAVICAVLLLWWCSGDKTPKGAPAVQAEAAPKAVVKPEPKREPARCVLGIAGMPAQEVLLFPTEEGLDEFSKAAASGDERAQTIAMSANAGFMVEPGTDCAWLDVGLAQTKVRVLAGKHAGKAGWAPTEWTRGP